MLARHEVEPAIESCAGMIAQQANQVYNRISPNHRRWIDREDLIQDGKVAAIQAAANYDPTQETKYSTYLWTGLKFYFSCHYIEPLRQQKRTTVALFELDRPIKDEAGRFESHGENCYERQADPTNASELYASTLMFVQLCRVLEPLDVSCLVGVLFFGSRQHYGRNLHRLRSAVQRTGASFCHLEALIKSALGSRMALTLLASDYSIGLGTETDHRILECVECSGRFALVAIRLKKFFPEAMMCRVCYSKMKQADPDQSCFGKAKTSEHEGYSENDVECRLHCQDRKACQQFIEEEKNMADKEAEGIDDMDFSDVETKTKVAKKKTAAKPATKAAKAVKSAPVKAEKLAKEKVSKDQDLPDPETQKEVGPRFPFKAGSGMRQIWKLMYKGISKKRIEELVTHPKVTESNPEPISYSWPLMRRIMRREQIQKNPTHTWKLDEAGDNYKIYDVKYIVGKAVAAATKPATKKANA